MATPVFIDTLFSINLETRLGYWDTKMALKRSQVVYISPLTLVALSACGGDSSDVSSVAASISQTVSGNVVNGPLSRVLIWLT